MLVRSAWSAPFSPFWDWLAEPSPPPSVVAVAPASSLSSPGLRMRIGSTTRTGAWTVLPATWTFVTPAWAAPLLPDWDWLAGPPPFPVSAAALPPPALFPGLSTRIGAFTLTGAWTVFSVTWTFVTTACKVPFEPDWDWTAPSWAFTGAASARPATEATTKARPCFRRPRRWLRLPLLRGVSFDIASPSSKRLNLLRSGSRPSYALTAGRRLAGALQNEGVERRSRRKNGA